jgi:F0F1-type ATP synthase beta subunit
MSTHDTYLTSCCLHNNEFNIITIVNRTIRIPEDAFRLVGSMDDVIAKAKDMGVEV